MNSMAANLVVLLTGSVCLYLATALIKVLNKYWWTPVRIQHAMNLQGIKGPPYRFIHGNNKESLKMKREALSKPMATLSHDFFPRAHTHVYSWINLYGKNYLSWVGNIPQLYITDPELVKEVLKGSESIFPKRTSRERKKNEENFVIKILGDGLVTSEGEKWARQRKLANYAFHGESLKIGSCVGMSFATTEMKIALSMILQRYTISLSPTYIHAPFILLALQPQHGIQVMLHSL